MPAAPPLVRRLSAVPAGVPAGSTRRWRARRSTQRTPSAVVVCEEPAEPPVELPAFMVVAGCLNFDYMQRRSRHRKDKTGRVAFHGYLAKKEEPRTLTHEVDL